MGVAAMVVAVVLWKQPPPPDKSLQIETARTRADAQLMTDIYQSVYESEPGAVQAVEGLFEAKR